MVDPHTNGCLQPEVLAAYVDRGLSLTERARVDAHLASCPQCIALVAGVARTVVEVSAHAPDVVVAAEATPFVTRRSLAGALAAAAAVIAVVVAPSFVRPWLDRDPRLVNLVESVGEQRSVLGRLTGGFPHAPLGAPSAGGQDGRATGTDRVLLTAGKVRESFGERETPSQLHALGVSQLLAGRYDDATQSLLAASREQPANAQYLSDVAAVQLERARLGLRPDDLPRALAAADRARRLDPSLKEAWFNRALAATALSLRDEAKDAWTEYLKRDSVSPWSVEAKARLGELSKPTAAQAWASAEGRLQQSLDSASAEAAVNAHVTESRRFIEGQLFPAWGAAVVAGSDGAAELDRARIMSEAMMRVTGDALYIDAVNAIDLASREGRPVGIARAHQQYAEAAAVYSDDQYARAMPLLRQAKVALEAVHSPYAIRPALDLAAVAYATGAYAESEQLLSDTLASARAHQYPYAEARVSWVRGLVAFAQGRLADAQTNYEDALGTLTRIADLEQIAAAHTLLAGLFYYLGDEEQAWVHFVPALKGLDITRSLKLRHALLSAAATSMRNSNPEAALAIQDETVRNAQEWGFQMAIAEALSLRATLREALGRSSEAATDLAAAKQEMAATDPAVKSRLEITVLLTESKLLRNSNPAAAVAAATRAIALTEARRDRFRLPQLELELANANIVWGRTAEAEVALERGIRAFDLERSTLTDEARASARDEAWGLFETSAHIAIQKKDYERAFALSERARVRSLAEARKMAAPKSLKAVQATLQDGEAILALNQFDNELAIWVIRHNDFAIVTPKLARLTAERLVARQQDEIYQQSTSPAASRALFDEIIRPVSSRLSGVTRLVIVPDTTFENASFSAFFDSSSGQFLVESLTVNRSPSANAFASVRERRSVAAVSGPLVFGGATEAAARRATEIAGAYPSSSLVTGNLATKTRFFEAAHFRPAVHIAVPIATSSSNPLLSRAVVADEPGRRHSGVIFGSDIASSAITTNLVVIEEIENSQTTRGEGTLSMARAFMTAGVPAVVGTLPGANESATRDLMISFHREMSKGLSAEQALQTVQRNALQQNGRRIGAWTALVMYGSDR